MHDHQGFENFRRERNKRRMEGGPLRPLGQNASVLRELEEAEQREVRNQQLTREVHEFFADATRTAATIVSQVAETAEERLQESVAQEMSEFLTDTMRRVQEFVQLVQVSAPPGLAQKDIEANIQNIVGATLDEFRFAGDAATAEAHAGQDPFATDLDLPEQGAPQGRAAPQEDEDGMAPRLSLGEHLGTTDADTDAEPTYEASEDEPSPIEEHFVAQVLEDEAEMFGDETESSSPFMRWFQELSQDDERTRNALRLLVRGNFMTKDEAREIYRAR